MTLLLNMSVLQKVMFFRKERWAGSSHRESELVIMKNMMIIIDKVYGMLTHSRKKYFIILCIWNNNVGLGISERDNQ